MPDEDVNSDLPEAEHLVLWEQFLAGRLDEAGAHCLLTWLEKNPEELPKFRNDARLSVALTYILGDEESSVRLVDSVQARVKAGIGEDDSAKFTKRVLDAIQAEASKSVRLKVVARRRWIGMSVAALFAVGVLVFAFARQTQPSKWTEGQLAQLTITEGSAALNGLTLTQSETKSVALGQTVALENGAKATLELRDGSVFSLSDSAKAILSDASQGFKIRLEHGKAVIQAAPQTENNRLRVETPHADVAVIGTKYTVEAFETLSWVSVESGKVSVTSSKKKEGENAESLLGAGDAAIADQGGLKVTHQTGQSRMLEHAALKTEMGSDPITLKDLSETFRDMPLKSFSYRRQNPPTRMDCGSFEWPVKLKPTEDEFEIWMRPKWVKPYVAEYRLVKVVMLVNFTRTQYCLGEVMMFPAGRDWVVLRGKLKDATVFWHGGGEKDPLKAENIKKVVIRTEIGEMDFDFTPLIIHDDGK